MAENHQKFSEAELKERGWAALRAPGGDPTKLMQLAKEIAERNLFGVARRIMKRAWQNLEDKPLTEAQCLELAQKHALYTYKDVDTPAHEALDRALKILIEDADLAATENAETLGLAGAIFKRKWQNDGDKQHLEASLAYYLRGHHKGTPSERGYTGVNAAYVLDFLAHVEEKQADETGTGSTTAEKRRSEARAIRQTIVDLFESVDKATAGGKKPDWWWYATLAEAHFGLGLDLERRGETDPGKKGDNIDDTHYGKAVIGLIEGAFFDPSPEKWEFESTARQLASLAQLQIGQEKLKKSDGWAVINTLFANNEEEAKALVGSVFKGKLGIGLSGGGFRASLFHIGVLARLAELDVLRQVDVLSCVSGGSIVGAHYYLKVRQLLMEKADDKIDRDDYIKLVKEMTDEFLEGVQRNLRTRLAGSFVGNLRMMFSRRYSRSDRLANLYEENIYALIGDDGKRTMDELKIEPRDADLSFSPKSDNWRRRNKVPVLVLNATSLNTGHNWQFTAGFMGESAFSVDDEIDGNWLLRRMSYSEAPKELQKIPLGQAVGASACVPGLFEPISLYDLYPKEVKRYPEMVVRLVDGGVHDNQGIVSLLEQDCSVIIVSDASGQMNSDPQPSGGFLAPVLRTNSILMERVRQSQFQDLKARLRAGLLKKLMIVHMKKAFDVEPVDWKTCAEPSEKRDDSAGDLLPYGVRKELQEMLAGVRTDLDSFSDVEAYALMTSGYLMASKYAGDLGDFLEPPEGAEGAAPMDWVFLQLEKPLGYQTEKGAEDLEANRQQKWVRKHLAVSGKKAFRVFSLCRPLKIVAAVVALAAFAAIVRAFWRPDSLLTALILIAGVLIAGFLVAIAWRWIVRILLALALAFVGTLVMQFHLQVLDRLFLKLGRLRDKSGA